MGSSAERYNLFFFSQMLKRRNFFIVIVLLSATLLVGGSFFFYSCEDDWCFLSDWQKIRATQSFEECEAHGFPVMQTYPRQCVAGSAAFVEKIEKHQEENIRITEPQPNDAIGLPFTLRGEARVFEGAFNYRLKDYDGTVLIERFATAHGIDAGQFGPFEISVSYPEPKGKIGILEVFDYSAKDGSEIDMVSVPVRFQKIAGARVAVFFTNQKKDPSGLSCEKTFPIYRRVAKSQVLARSALLELLKGPDRLEYEAGYGTAINSGTALQKISIENGVARVDFDSMLEVGVGGSCRVLAIESQIKETLKQFPTVKEVVISINGRTEGVLQP